MQRGGTFGGCAVVVRLEVRTSPRTVKTRRLPVTAVLGVLGHSVDRGRKWYSGRPKLADGYNGRWDSVTILSPLRH